MLRSCKYCNRIHDSKHDCGKKPQRKKQGNDKDKFRSTNAWNKKRTEIRERDLYLCVACKHNNTFTYDNLECHHIIPLEEDYELRLENDNLITLCCKCHELAEKGKISRRLLKDMITYPRRG